MNVLNNIFELKNNIEILIFEILCLQHGTKKQKPNIFQQNAITLPSIGHFVGDLVQKGKTKSKNELKFGKQNFVQN